MPAEGGVEELEFGGAADGVDRDNVKPYGNGTALLFRKGAEIDAGQAAQHATLGLVDRRFGRVQIACGAGFYFNEAEGGTVPCNQIDVPTQAGMSPTASDDNVAPPTQFKKRSLLAEQAGFEVGGSGKAMSVVYLPQNLFLRVQPLLFELSRLLHSRK